MIFLVISHFFYLMQLNGSKEECGSSFANCFIVYSALQANQCVFLYPNRSNSVNVFISQRDFLNLHSVRDD